LKDLVFLSGWGFDSRVWQPVAERLSDKFRIAYDLDAAPAGAIACGWSLGAIRVLKSAVVACNAPHGVRLAKLVLVGATPRFVQAPDWPCAQPPDLLDGFAAAVAADPRAALRRLAALLNQGDERARELTRKLTALINERIDDDTTLAAGLAELRDTDLRKSAVVVRLPTLLIHGERDPLMPLAAGRWLAEHMPDARLEIFPGAAHAPFLSQPDRFVEMLQRFADD
jgi:pimeloyl-[acyl-carrier protein] methyl ester esterase